MAAVAASAANEISRAPAIAARTRPSPCSARRKMFSSTMIASSTTMPTASESPSSVNVFSVKPRKCITANVPMMDVGIDSRTLIVEEIEPRKSQHTSAVRSTASTSVSSISWIDSSTGPVASNAIATSTPSGRVPRTSSRRAWTRVGDLDRVRAALLADAQPLRRLHVVARDHAAVLETVLDGRDVGERRHASPRARRRRAPGSPRPRGRLAPQPDVQLPLAPFEAARGQLDVLAQERRDHVGRGDVPGVHAHGVEPDAQAPLAVAAEHDLADARHRLQALAHAARDLGQLLRRPHPATAAQRIGWSSGLLFVMTGGSSAFGRRRCACATRVCVSCSAASMSRPTSNSSVTVARPCWDDEEMSTIPSTLMQASSTISTTSVSIVSGRRALERERHRHLREVDVGHLADAQPLEPERPEHDQPAMSIQAKTGLRTAASEILIGRPSGPPAGAAGVPAGWRSPRGSIHGDRHPVREDVARRARRPLAHLQPLHDLDEAVARAQPQGEHPGARLAVLDHVRDPAALAGLQRRVGDGDRLRALRSPPRRRRRTRAGAPRRAPELGEALDHPRDGAGGLVHVDDRGGVRAVGERGHDDRRRHVGGRSARTRAPSRGSARARRVRSTISATASPARRYCPRVTWRRRTTPRIGARTTASAAAPARWRAAPPPARPAPPPRRPSAAPGERALGLPLAALGLAARPPRRPHRVRAAARAARASARPPPRTRRPDSTPDLVAPRDHLLALAEVGARRALGGRRARRRRPPGDGGRGAVDAAACAVGTAASRATALSASACSSRRRVRSTTTSSARGLDHGPLLEGDRLDDPVDARGHRHDLVRLERARPLDDVDEVAALEDRRLHGDRAAAALLRRAARARAAAADGEDREREERDAPRVHDAHAATVGGGTGFVNGGRPRPGNWPRRPLTRSL